jgi:periplasmic protein TonB
LSYHSEALDPRRRNAGIAGVIVCHALLAYGLVTGLSMARLIDPTYVDRPPVLYFPHTSRLPPHWPPDPHPHPPPPPPHQDPARGARPSNALSSWITQDDYPAGEDPPEGVAAYRLIVGTNGRVSVCDIVRSTGDHRLDEATCKFITRRARFEPATDETGAKVVGSYTGTVKWEIPD